MPTYVYMCRACGLFEKMQAMSDPPLECCPTCGREVARRLQPGGGHIVKGEAPACGEPVPCCGRQQRCDKPHCGN